MTQKTDKFDGIQIGRAVAALSVLYFHSWEALVRFPATALHPIWPLDRVGELGVDLFFGISGFVICLIIEKGDFRPFNFLTRRVFRIYPLWLLMLFTFAIFAAMWRGWQNNETLGYLLYSATLLPTHELPFYGVGWTLQHEMAFYVTVAALAPFVGISGTLVFLVATFLIFHDHTWYSLTAWHLEFGAGMLAFLLKDRLHWAGSLAPITLGLAGLAALFLWFGRPFVAPALFVAIVGFVNLKPSGRFGQYLLSVGNQSYSIYLVHPLILLGCSAVTSKLLAHIPLWSVEPIRFACIFVTIVTAKFTFKYVEKPSIKAGAALAGRLREDVARVPQPVR